MKQSVFPYKPKHVTNTLLRPVDLNDGGSEGNINKNAWMSDGFLKPFEMGLPVIGTLPPALDPSKPSPLDNMVNVLVNRPYISDFKKMYGGLADKYPDMPIDDPDSRSNAEKQFIMQNSKDPNDLKTNNELKIKVQSESGRPSCRSTLTSTSKNI